MAVLIYIILLAQFGIMGSLLIDTSSFGEVRSGGSVIMQILQFSGGIYAVAVFANSRDATALLKRAAPIFLLALLALVSSTWSVDYYQTFRRSISLTISFLFAIALVARYGTTGALHLIVQAMAISCVLSVFYVLVDPRLAIHQATEKVQSVHAGLWRGLMGHKVGLGMFSGVAIAMLSFLGPRSCGNIVFWGIALICAIACLIGSGSATGIVSMGALGGLLFIGPFFTTWSYATRTRLTLAFNLAMLVFAYMIFTGSLDTLARYLGRSADLTGRATYWPHVEAFIKAHGYYLGFGYGAGFNIVGPLIEQTARMRLDEAHNGILELIVDLGHIGLLIVMSMYAWFVWRASRLVVEGDDQLSASRFFPYALLATLFLVSYVESIILSYNGIWCTLFAVSLAILHQHETEIEALADADAQDDDEDFAADDSGLQRS